MKNYSLSILYFFACLHFIITMQTSALYTPFFLETSRFSKEQKREKWVCSSSLYCTWTLTQRPDFCINSEKQTLSYSSYNRTISTKWTKRKTHFDMAFKAGQFHKELMIDSQFKTFSINLNARHVNGMTHFDVRFLDTIQIWLSAHKLFKSWLWKLWT